jgi:pimeloyl-ACP methyl ester carboxylesterase
MHSLSLILPILGLAGITSAAAILSGSSKGFTQPVWSSSVGGQASCISGTVAVQASAPNTLLHVESPPDQFASTEIFIEYFQVNSSLPTSALGSKSIVSGTYNINAKLCVPTAASAFPTVQFLIHGINFDKLYWEIPDSSYIDAAASAGYATFSYDRLGTGASDHPDPIQVVQSALQIEIAHQMIEKLRSGAFCGNSFQHVVGVGHSYGSIQAVGLAVQYPEDLDAIILQGFTINTSNLPALIDAFNPSIASDNAPLRFGTLPAGYQVVNSAIGTQMTFYRYPNFDTSVFTSLYSQKQTFTLGEFFTLTAPIAPATLYTGPVLVANGENDFIFCASDCTFPSDQGNTALSALFPAAAAGSASYIAPGTGHALNAHTSASITFSEMLTFIEHSGF